MIVTKKLLDRIPTTKERAVHLAALESELAMSEHQVKANIRLLELQGIPICKDKDLYWIAENDLDIKYHSDNPGILEESKSYRARKKPPGTTKGIQGKKARTREKNAQ